MCGAEGGSHESRLPGSNLGSTSSDCRTSDKFVKLQTSDLFNKYLFKCQGLGVGPKQEKVPSFMVLPFSWVLTGFRRDSNVLHFKRLA